VVVSLVVLCAVPMLVLAWLRYRLHFPAGDEPHYLIISEALERYHSLDVQRVYDNRDYAGFFPWPIDPHTTPAPSGRLLPLHSIGGPVLWLIPFVMWGRAGVLAFMVGVSLLIVANVYWLSRQLRVTRRTAFMVGLGFGVGTPVLTYSSLSFVEPIGALGCVYALRVLHTPQLRTRDLLLVSTCLGVLPWVHSRFLLFPPVFLVLLLLRLRREEGWARRGVCVLGPAVGLFLGLELYHLALWQTLDLAPNQTNAGAVPLQSDPMPALAGTVFDQEAGFIPNFPIFLLVLPGILFAASRSWLSLHVHVTAAVVPYTLMVCSFPAWAGAWSPPARFMVVVLPMLAGYIAVAMQRVHRVVVFALAGSATIYAGVLTTLAVFTPDGGFSAQCGESPALAALGALTHLQLASWVPSAAINGQRMMFAAWMAAATGLGVVVRLLDRDRIVRLGGEEPER
jgi:hypothetical protein